MEEYPYPATYRPPLGQFYHRPGWASELVQELQLDVPERLPDEHTSTVSLKVLRRAAASLKVAVAIRHIGDAWWVCRIAPPR